MTTYASANTAYRRPAPLRPDWSSLLVGATLAALLWLSTGTGPQGGLGLPASLIRTERPTVALATGERKLQAALRAAHLTPAEARRVRAVLADARESRRAAVAFYEALHETDPPGSLPARQVHAAEIEALVEGTVRAKLADTLGTGRARALGRHVGPLVATAR
jgi:hypothetical protein